MKLKSALLDTRPRRQFFWQTGFCQAFSYLTSGVYLSGLALSMNAGDLLISYLSIILNLCGVLILFLAPFVNRARSRKRLALLLTALSKAATLLIVLVPVLIPAPARLGVLVAVVVLAFTLQAQTTVGINQWMLTFVDEPKKSRYLSLRQTLLMAVTVVLSLAGGYWMDYSDNAYYGFAAVFGAAAVTGIAELILLARIPDAPAVEVSGAQCRWRDLARLPFRDRRYLGFVVYVACFYLFLYVSDSFTMVYLMKSLALPYTTVNALYMIISLPQLLMLGVWGKIGDRRGAGFVLNVSIWLFVLETLLMFFAGPGTWFVFVPLAFFVAAIANAGFAVSVFNRRYELMPKTDRVVYDNFSSAAIGVAFILGPLLGGAFKGLFEAAPGLGTALPFAGIRLLYLISAAAILLLQIVAAVARRSQKHAECEKDATANPARQPLPAASAPAKAVSPRDLPGRCRAYPTSPAAGSATDGPRAGQPALPTRVTARATPCASESERPEGAAPCSVCAVAEFGGRPPCA